MNIDGYWGQDTTIALQSYFGMLETGNIHHQWAPNIQANPGLTSGWLCDDTLIGDVAIRRLQELLGVDADGIMGEATIRNLQVRMGTPADGRLDAGSTCIRELQSRLNQGWL